MTSNALALNKGSFTREATANNSTSYSNGSKSYHGSSSYSTTSYSQNPVKVFDAHGIEFWGCAKTKLDDITLDSTDLIINCTGTEYSIKPFVKSAPKWMILPNSDTDCDSVPQQLLLDWKDMQPPPNQVRINFWEEILRQAKKHGITRIICCCFAGQGRTGTALISFMLALGVIDDPGQGIEFLRENYNSKAVEQDSQELYLYNLIYDLAGLLSELKTDED